MASTSEITQLAHSSHTCQVRGPLSVRLKRVTPEARALKMELLSKN